MGNIKIGYIMPSIMDFEQRGWMICDGRRLNKSQHGDLFNIIGYNYGGDGRENFAIPDLRGRVAIGAGQNLGGCRYDLAWKGGEKYNTISASEIPVHNHKVKLMGSNTQADTYDPTKQSFANVQLDKKYSNKSPNVEMRLEDVEPVNPENEESGKMDNRMPSATVNFMINVSDNNGIDVSMLCNIILWPGKRVPDGWHLCDGKIMSVNENSALYSLLGTYFGGDGFRTFALPDLRGRIPVGHLDNGKSFGEMYGSEENYIDQRHLPGHSHRKKLCCTYEESDTTVAEGNIPGGGGTDFEYTGKDPDTVMHEMSISSDVFGNRGEQGYLRKNNMQPYLSLNYIICIDGIYPARS